LASGTLPETTLIFGGSLLGGGAASSIEKVRTAGVGSTALPLLARTLNV
jgi:hypothetical protein